MSIKKINMKYIFLLFSMCFALIYIQNFSSKSTKSKTKENQNINIKNKNLNQFNLVSRKKYEKWIVVTSINDPSKQMKKLSNEKEFKLVVVSDLKTNQNWSLENSVFLSVKHQINLNYKSLSSTAFYSYTRKNIGYLYAIQNGAQFIYDTDDDNEPISPVVDFFDFKKTKKELEYDNNSPLILNPLAHFGQPTIWPRGYPLGEINKKSYNDYICIEKPTSIVQQSVVDGDPDVDAIFRLTKSIDSKRIEIEFDYNSPSVRIPMYKLTPYNAQNTLVNRFFYFLILG